MGRVSASLSLAEFKRDTTRALKLLRSTKEPQVLAVSGGASVVVQDAAAYRRLVARLAAAEERIAVNEALVAMDEGDAGSSIEKTFERVGKRAAARRRSRA